VSVPRARAGHSSVMNRAVDTATGTPITSAVAEVMSVPTSSGRAPNTPPCTSQSLAKLKPSRPNRANAGIDSIHRRTKKNPIRTRIDTASAVNPHRRARSGSRASGGRSRIERPPRTPIARASMPRYAPALGFNADPLQVRPSTLALACWSRAAGSGAYCSSGATFWPGPTA
jgi:hypothetical protein